MSRIEIGTAARRALAPGRRGRVLARFARSFYAATGGGIACIGMPGLGRGPLNLLVRLPARLPSPGERLRCARGLVRFAGGLEIALTGARLWRPPRAGRRARLPGRLPRPAYPFPAECRALERWLAAGARGRAPARAARLIGLGAGLTPAGDDFVGGALLALHAVGERAAARRLARWALALARRRTGRISRAHLACAAAGEGHEALHRALAALLEGRTRLDRERRELARIGHRSGLDALSGALAALRAHRARTRPSRSPARARPRARR